MKHICFSGRPQKEKDCGSNLNQQYRQLFSWISLAVLLLIGQVGMAQQTITHSQSQTVTPLHGVACSAGPNSFIRAFDLATDFGITSDFVVSEAQFGVEAIDFASSLAVTVNIYSTSGTFPVGFPGNATLRGISTTTITVADESQVVSVPVVAVIPFGEIVIYEVTTEGVFYPGSNDAGETDFSYMMGSSCEITEPSTYAEIDPDFSDIHLVMNIIGDEVIPCAGIPDGGTALVTPGSGAPGSTYTVNASGHTIADGMSYQWQADFGSGWQDQGAASTIYNVYTATAQGAVGETEQWRLQSTCIASGETSYSTVAIFNVFYCIPVISSTVEPITNVVFNDIDNASSPTSTDAYEDFTAIEGNVNQGGTYEFIAEGNTGGSFTNLFTVWIDWNQNGVFENDEMYEIGSINNSTGTDGVQASAFIYVPEGIPAGSTTMRVIKNFSSSPTDPCGTYSYGQVEDYTLLVGPPPSCIRPVDLITSNYTTTSADIEWTAVGSETTWNVSWGIPGYTPGDGNEVGSATGVTTNPYQITGLTPDTDYEVYVQADCGAGDESMWAGPITIQTFCEAIPALGFCEDFEDESTLGCWGVIDNNQDGDAWQTYTGYANSGNQSAGIDTDFNNGDNDDYLVLPRMTLTGNEVMSFYYRARSASEPNDFRVVLSTTGISPADFDEEVMALMQVSNTTYKDTVVDLSAYTGDVYIAFHVPPGGLDGYYLYIDDVCIDICVPEAGVNGTAEICREDGSIDLNTVITSDYTHGTWSFPANEGLVNGSTLATGVLPSGTYEAIYVVEGGCTSDTTVATIDVFGPSSAGTGGVITVCKGAAIDLYSALSGNVDMGGDWYDYNGNLLGTSQPTAPSLGASYNYTYIASNGVCDADTAFVEVIVDASPECTSSIQEEMTVNLSVYPNPTTDVINIVNPTNISALKVEVMDMNGRIVLVEENALNNSTEASISLGKLTIGVYTLRVYNEEGQKVFKVVKR